MEEAAEGTSGIKVQNRAIRALFDRLGGASLGVVHWREFAKWALLDALQRSRINSTSLLREWDIDGDGRIDVYELRKVVRELGVNPWPVMPKISTLRKVPDEGEESQESSWPKRSASSLCSNGDIDVVFHMLDVDGNGFIFLNQLDPELHWGTHDAPSSQQHVSVQNRLRRASLFSRSADNLNSMWSGMTALSSTRSRNRKRAAGRGADLGGQFGAPASTAVERRM